MRRVRLTDQSKHRRCKSKANRLTCALHRKRSEGTARSGYERAPSNVKPAVVVPTGAPTETASDNWLPVYAGVRHWSAVMDDHVDVPQGLALSMELVAVGSADAKFNPRIEIEIPSQTGMLNVTTLVSAGAASRHIHQ